MCTDKSFTTKDSASCEHHHPVIEKLKETPQTTVNDTGWTETQKARMRQFGYDDMDIVRAWQN